MDTPFDKALPTYLMRVSAEWKTYEEDKLHELGTFLEEALANQQVLCACVCAYMHAACVCGCGSGCMCVCTYVRMYFACVACVLACTMRVFVPNLCARVLRVSKYTYIDVCTS